MHITLQRNFARNMRKSMTGAERLVWSKLKSRGLRGFRFNRQVEIGPYIVDLVCREKKVIFEVDGPTHGDTHQINYDQRRTKYLEDEGYVVVRSWNMDIYENCDAVLERLAQVLESRSG